MAKRVKCDVSSPESRALVDEIVHGTFMKEGTMVAFPMCFPGASLPIVPDESHITALDSTPEGIIYGGTSGRQTHLFVGMFHGVTGVVFDMGMVPGADRCVAMCCGQKKFVACVNGPGGGRVILRHFQGLPFDLIQEWGFGRQPYQDLGEVAPGERIVHAVASLDRGEIVGVTDRHLFVVVPEEETLRVAGEIQNGSRIAVGSNAGIWGMEDSKHLWRYDVASRNLTHRAVQLPKGAWDPSSLRWAKDALSGILYVADSDGTLFSFEEGKGFSPSLGRSPVAPAGPMAVTFDGRLFGFCGDELSKMFCYDPHQKTVSPLGVAVSIIERRRYGYTFGDAVTGRDGEIVFGEDDDRGHLWLYFPKIRPR